ncbi:MAG: PAS domain S-box protein [bacterium]|nr:PAS domain S-box protein [bacterium]
MFEPTEGFSMIITLIDNICLLLAMSICHAFVLRHCRKGTLQYQLIAGGLFGLTAVAGMMNPFILAPGIIFDGRSMICGLAGLFGGPVTALLVCVIAGGYRAYVVGGGGVLMGLLVVLMTSWLGVVFHYLVKQRPQRLNELNLYLFGLLIHAVMIGLMLFLPANVRFEVFRRITLPVMILFPIGTVLIGKLLRDQEIFVYIRNQVAEGERRFHEALINLPFPAVIHDENGKIVFINRLWTELSGYSHSEIPTIDDWVELVYEDRKSEIRSGIAALYQYENRIQEGSFFIKSKSGEKRIWDFNSVPLGRDENGTRRVMSVAVDVTEKHDREELLKAVFDNAPVMINIFAPDGRCVFVNDAWQKTLGFSLEDINSPGFFEKMYPDPETLDRLNQAIRKAERKWNTYRTLTANGSVLDTMWMTTRLSNGYMMGIGLDISELKLLQQQLLQSQKMESIGRLAGGVAHDFNNILTAIIGYTEFATNKVDSDHPAHGDLIEIGKAADRAVHLTRHLLAFSRKQILQTKVIDLNELIVDLDKMLRRLIGEDIEYVTLTSPELWRIKTDPGQVEHALTNLVINARDAMPSGGKLTIETRSVHLDETAVKKHLDIPSGDYVMLAVSDTGVGIPPNLLEKIFEPFFTTKGKGKGTGLGLSTVHGIVKQSGGDVTVYSEPGAGTTVKMYFPRVDESPRIEKPHVMQIDRYRGDETILLAEDDELVRSMIGQTLGAAGYKVISASYATEAIEIFDRTTKIDLLITDVIMPQVSGKELAETLQNKQPGLKTLFISGYTDNAIVHHGVLDEGVHFLQKPFTSQQLLKTVRELIDRN